MGMPAPGMFDGGPGGIGGDFPQIDMGGASARYIPTGPLAPTPSGYIPGAPIMATPALGEGLARLQAGETGFDLGGGAFVQFSGIPQGTHNVLRDLQESPLGKKANQLESMTIELVAMLFDFIFETKDLPDGIKALLARLQIPVLKAAMLDGAFFAKKGAPVAPARQRARRSGARLVAGDGAGGSALQARSTSSSTGSSTASPTISRSSTSCARISRRSSPRRRRPPKRTSRRPPRRSTRATAGRSRRRYRRPRSSGASSNIRFRISWRRSCARIGSRALENVYLQQGEESEAWGQAVATLEDLVWSVQPKKSNEDRRHLVALLPSLLKRMSAGMQSVSWPPDDRERFMSNLVEAHAAAVKPALAAVALPTAAVAEQAKAEAVIAKAAGDEVAAAKAEQLAAAMEQAEPAPVEPTPEVIEDQFLEIAQNLERGMWIEFEADDGQLAFAKLAWISPLRGTYLFTNRQGQKALSMTAEELAERFRSDRARLVEAEPLIDRAFGSMMQQIDTQFPETEAAADVTAKSEAHRRADHRRRNPVGQARRQASLARDRARLSARGLDLAWARYEGDDRARLTAVLRESFAAGDLVFSFGGVGATPDDHTRQAAAAALGVPLVRHPRGARARSRRASARTRGRIAC